MTKLRELTLSKLKTLEAQKAEVEKQHDDLKQTVAALEKEIETGVRTTEAERKKQDELKRERDILTKLKAQARPPSARRPPPAASHLCSPCSPRRLRACRAHSDGMGIKQKARCCRRQAPSSSPLPAGALRRQAANAPPAPPPAQAENATLKQSDLVKMADGTRKTLEQEIMSYRAEAQRAERNVTELERERDRYISDLRASSAQYAATLEEARAAPAPHLPDRACRMPRPRNPPTDS